MSKRKPAPDLLGDLLSESSSKPAQAPVEPKINASVSEPTYVVPSPQRAEMYASDTVKEEQQPKVKMTLVLPPEVADRLAKFEMEMRFATGERGHALSKSAIIAKSLEILLDEYDTQQMYCRIAIEMKP